MMRAGSRGNSRQGCGTSRNKARGKQSTKIFQIKEDRFDPGKHPVGRKYSFRDLSTRKHHPGRHQISIIVNGVEKATASFELLDRTVVEGE